MRVAVECKSPLLQKALEMFLAKNISTLKQCDIVVRDERSDEKNSFFISSDSDADLIKPFSSSQLILALEKKYLTLDKKSIDIVEEKLDFEILQRRIEALTNEYQKNILNTVRAFYEK